MSWLLLFGLIHAYIIWSGDILVAYSLCGMLLFVFRNLRPRSLLWTGLGFFIIPILFNVFTAISIPFWPEESYQEIMQIWRPDTETIQHEIEGMHGGWMDQMEYRAEDAIFMQTQYFMMATFWRVMSMMLLGMALYKWKILSAERSSGFYVRMTLIGLGSGYLLSILGIVLNVKDGWTMEYSMFLGPQLNSIGSVGVALGYAALIMLICRSARLVRFKSVFGAVGRMAFTNYILQSVICVFIFYGTGLGLYGSIERKYQLLFVLGIWITLLIISSLWLKHYRFGPLEWLWRSLTYWRRQLNKVFVITLLLAFSTSTWLHSQVIYSNDQVDVIKLEENIFLLKENYKFTANCLVIAGDKGLMMLDTGFEEIGEYLVDAVKSLGKEVKMSYGVELILDLDQCSIKKFTRP